MERAFRKRKSKDLAPYRYRRKKDVELPERWEEVMDGIDNWVLGIPITVTPQALIEIRDRLNTLRTRMDEMDKQINKIKKDLDKGEKDTKKLLKMDKKQDKKMAACNKKMKKK